MKPPIVHLTVAAVRSIHREVLASHGGASGVRDENLLESAVAAPQATMLGEPLLTEPVEIAAAYFFYLCRNHPFVDGNKRVALAACLVFLSENGLLPEERLAADEWEEMAFDVAAGRVDRTQTTARLRSLLRGG